MKWVSTKSEGKMLFKSKLKLVALAGLVLSALSLFTHFLLAKHTYGIISESHSSVTIISWMPKFKKSDLSINHPSYRRLWAPARRLESLHPHANRSGDYAAPEMQSTGFIFVKIRGGFHEIRNAISDVVVVSRLLNATLVIPEIQSTTSSKGISTQFKSFPYLYNEGQFIAALAKDVKIVKTLPKDLKGARRKKEIPSFKVPHGASPYFYLHHVLPMLTKHSVVELLVSSGGCLQSILPPHLVEYQKLRCRVAFHALRFREEVQNLAIKTLNRIRASGQPFIAYDPGMTRDALAYYGCAELFQDVHTELIMHRRAWMIKRGILKGNLSSDSAEQYRNGLCPLMPEEIGILLRAYGYSSDTIIYISGGEVFGGLKKLIPLHAMFENVVDRTSLSSPLEWDKIYGWEANLVDQYSIPPPSANVGVRSQAWKNSGPRPRPLPPPPARPKMYNVEGWWGWVAESDDEPESTIMELRTNAHRLLWEAIDYMVCIEADAFITGFDRDGKGNPNLASLVVGHRLYQFPASRTYGLDREFIEPAVCTSVDEFPTEHVISTSVIPASAHNDSPVEAPMGTASDIAAADQLDNTHVELSRTALDASYSVAANTDAITNDHTRQSYSFKSEANQLLLTSANNPSSLSTTVVPSSDPTGFNLCIDFSNYECIPTTSSTSPDNTHHTTTRTCHNLQNSKLC